MFLPKAQAISDVDNFCWLTSVSGTLNVSSIERNTMQAEWFEEFARNLLQEKGVNLPDEEVQKQLTTDISVRARDVVLARLIDDMSDDELQKLELATDSGDTATADGIISRHQTVITTSLAEFKGMYLRKK